VNQLCQWFREGRLKPHIDRTFPLERAAAALTVMATRNVMGKVVLIGPVGPQGASVPGEVQTLAGRRVRPAGEFR
jgi:hypothetical protein